MRKIQGVTDERAYAATARRAMDAARFRFAHEVPNDQEVVRETKLANDAKLAIQTRHDLVGELPVDQALRVVRVTSLEPFDAEFAKVFVGRETVGGREDREKTFPKFKIEFATIRDIKGAPHRVGVLGNRVEHLLAALEIEFRRIHAHPIRVRAHLTGVDAQRKVLRVRIFVKHVVNVVRRDRWNTELFRELKFFLQRNLLIVEPVILQFHIITVAEKLLVP